MPAAALALAVTLILSSVCAVDPVKLTEVAPIMTNSWGMRVQMQSHTMPQLTGIFVIGDYFFGVGDDYDSSWALSHWTITSDHQKTFEMEMSIRPQDNTTYHESIEQCTAMQGTFIPFHPDYVDEKFEFKSEKEDTWIFTITEPFQFMTASLDDAIMDLHISKSTGFPTYINTTGVEYLVKEIWEEIEPETNRRPQTCQEIYEEELAKLMAAEEEDKVEPEDIFADEL
ncbi:hypothetical protein J8273_4437 [Carpediemonas membranifera]|uniref:Uncharacterized protein n=1 Tax=Carpediemonas membranifera TaxID=201153 RepID=A0A8J6DZT1_9EUKA|nr:hypothetical protein J8273_4437 [Carpediemonas membranifera]|eukprot:KAG9394074.1 hypothetical protein J8273_4437 [Carpediemonas membranifera]